MKQMDSTAMIFLHPWRCSQIFLSSLLLATVTGCVSVNIKSDPPAKSKFYEYVEPTKPFVRMKNEETDLVWQNSQNGNTIAILSECSDSKDPSLTALESETIQALNNEKIISSKDLSFAERAARRSQVEGTLDGIPVKMDVLTFKKNSCSYTLTYVGRAQGFDRDQAAFDRFLSGFRVQ